jgi:hypothetical protein
MLWFQAVEERMRRTWWISLLLVGLIVAAVGGGLYGVLVHVPAFYASAAQAPGARREQSSHDFESRVFTLGNDIAYEKHWKFTSTADQINSYLAEDFIKSNTAKFLPKTVSDVRVQYLQDEVAIGFKYGLGEFQTVVSLRARVWLPKKEPSTLVVEILSLQAGALPIAVKALHEGIAEQLRTQNIKALWYRKDGNPTVVLKFQADRREPTFHFKRLEIKPGQLHIEGSTLDPEAPKGSVDGIGRLSQ